MASNHTTILADNITLINDLLADLLPDACNPRAMTLAVDLEGIDLCRHGKISLVQIMSSVSEVVWLVDVTTLGSQAFDHVDPYGRTLRMILEDTGIKKVFYDVRNDADALYNLYGVNLMGVYDLQLLELAVRHSLRRQTRLLNGLSKSIKSYLTPPVEWEPVKEAGSRLFKPEFGGSYSVFEERPLDPRIVAYCAQDVTLLFALEETLRRSFGRFGSNWEDRIVAGSALRVSLAKGAYEGKGRHMALAPVL
ncbi:uncharacterized protein LACBIDRAFT_189721 [Laccaria bicolor S238N-H82]|uniref:Predicted protein n=1 Tax=Laccaria bicolor (strain S238N-H82 / ATCC MYA-4686) TaxID=486041 RepID=B0D496_LACBS|nr:uncharacterized protein LACBIDRAFT_189721 [Laccaria bicolor S238N-H82]EDR10536.1 predicted protein [Laccaria bicolor S238N-H82]|eukprot:XP_001878986.1 predicted protein [Laccaria bicolor S238N-H82]